jgi:hypothetical protein
MDSLSCCILIGAFDPAECDLSFDFVVKSMLPCLLRELALVDLVEAIEADLRKGFSIRSSDSDQSGLALEKASVVGEGGLGVEADPLRIVVENLSVGISCIGANRPDEDHMSLAESPTGVLS